MVHQELAKLVDDIYGLKSFSPCTFTKKEQEELEHTNELIVYLPSNISPEELCDKFEIKTNINFKNEKMIRTVMDDEDQWFITAAGKTPELLHQTANEAKRIYERKELHGMDLRRYLAFIATFKQTFGEFPDEKYWSFLLSSSYDRSGISIVGFDKNGVLSHHGWMKNFKSKFVGSRYVVLPPRIEILPETEIITRSYRK